LDYRNQNQSSDSAEEASSWELAQNGRPGRLKLAHSCLKWRHEKRALCALGELPKVGLRPSPPKIRVFLPCPVACDTRLFAPDNSEYNSGMAKSRDKGNKEVKKPKKKK
jgi:hypothetical protein